jgi:hypothetical protein
MFCPKKLPMFSTAEFGYVHLNVTATMPITPTAIVFTAPGI